MELICHLSRLVNVSEEMDELARAPDRIQQCGKDLVAVVQDLNQISCCEGNADVRFQNASSCLAAIP